MLLTLSDGFVASRRTIKHHHLFLVDNPEGMIPDGNPSGLGLYHRDTRFLSCFELRLNDTVPVPLLSSTEAGYLSTVVATNGVMTTPNQVIPEETIQLKRESVLCGALLDKWTLTNYNPFVVTVEVALRLDADFRDIFEVRHLVRQSQRGTLAPPVWEGGIATLVLAYRDPQGHCAETRIRFVDAPPDAIDTATRPVVVRYSLRLQPLEAQILHLTVETHAPEEAPDSRPEDFGHALKTVRQQSEAWSQQATDFLSDNEDFNEMLRRSHKDIRMLMTPDGELSYVAAGIPWYTCLFGRDSLLTARSCLMLQPDIARQTLHLLARYQGQTHDAWRDEAPGKILHERRTGELARLGEIPHTPYYGTVDATPLWLILLHDYTVWTQDDETLQALWPHALAALDWLESSLAASPHGYLTYQRQNPQGLYHQGWKDSHNSAMYGDGAQAEPPIALAEVQGYVYHARWALAALAERRGDRTLKRKLQEANKGFKRRFNQDFWLETLGFCALGLDANGRPLDVVTSNPGHCLETGLLSHAHAQQVAARIGLPDMDSGWGIRTLSAEARAYNPMSYHNGSVWPHDNALIAKGLVQTGHPESADRIFNGLFEAARLTFYKRLPELFCGFPRDPHTMDPPVRYPVACSPQAWAAASVYSLLHSLLNVAPDGEGSLHIHQPRLPGFLNWLQVHRLRVGDSTVDLEFRRTRKNIVVDVLERRGPVKILLSV